MTGTSTGTTTVASVTSVTAAEPSTDRAVADAFGERLFTAGLAAAELLCAELGLRLGLYAALHEHGPLTSAGMAATTGLTERYAREWLEQQACAGVLTTDPATPGGDRAYALPPGHAVALLDGDDLAYLAPMAGLAASAGRMLPALTAAYRDGHGVPYADYDFHEIQAAFTRPVFRNQLVQEWLPALPALHARLEAGEPLRVADVGCGLGRAGIAIALAYPAVTVDGFDLDEASVKAANDLAVAAGVADRVRFVVVDLGTPPPPDRSYDLVLSIEMLHDVADPVGLLRGMREVRAEGGEVLVVDERAAERFTAPGDEMERFLYVASVLHCLPVSLAEAGSAGTGTVIRSATVREYATAAGFADVETLAVEHPQFRLHRMVPWGPGTVSLPW